MKNKFLVTAILFACTFINAYSVQDWGMADILVKVLSGKANCCQADMDIDRTFDGNFGKNYYHSPHSGYTVSDATPVILEYFFQTDPEKPNYVSVIDYIKYYPRTDGINGNFGRFDLYFKSTTDGDYVKYNSYDFKILGTPSIISIENGFQNPAAIKFVVNSGGNNFATCAEMEFYQSKAQHIQIPTNIFKDQICSGLVAGVTQSDVNAITEPFFKALAQQMYDGTYSTKFRVQSYKAYMHPDKDRLIKKTNARSLLDNPTGIFVEKGEELVFFSKGIGDKSISLRQVDLTRAGGFGKVATYPVVEGINVIKATMNGLIYVMYHTDDNSYKTAPEIQIHFALSRENGYFDPAKGHTDETWKSLLANAVSDTTYMDMVGKYAHTSFPVEDCKKYCPEQATRQINMLDSLVYLEDELLGLGYGPGYTEPYTNRAFMQRIYGGNPSATSYHTNYPSANAVLDYQSIRVTGGNLWTAIHEVGHTHQTSGFNWIKMAEVSVNIYSLYVQHKFGFESRLHTQPGTPFKDDYDRAFNYFVVPNTMENYTPPPLYQGHSLAVDAVLFPKLVPFWQLYLYATYVKNYPSFYMDLHQILRDRNIPSEQGRQVLDFTEICSELLQEDLSGFFQSYGFYIPINQILHSYGDALMSITQAEIDATKAKNARFPKPVHKIEYITDTNYAAYRDRLSVERGTQSKTDNILYTTFTFSNWKNVAVYEVYDDNKLVFVSRNPSFVTIKSTYEPNDPTDPTTDYKVSPKTYRVSENAKIYAVAYDGSKVDCFDTALETVNMDNIVVYSQDGKVIVKGTDKPFSVYTVEGQLMKPGRKLSSGVYIVSIENQTKKVIVK